MCETNEIDEIIYESWIGNVIKKKSNKPFKSTLRKMIPIGIEISHYSDKLAFKFADGTVVDCHQCEIVEK